MSNKPDREALLQQQIDALKQSHIKQAKDEEFDRVKRAVLTAVSISPKQLSTPDFWQDLKDGG